MQKLSGVSLASFREEKEVGGKEMREDGLGERGE